MLVSKDLERWVTTERNHWLCFGFLLVIAQFLAFPFVFLGLETFIYRDFGFFGYPLAHFHREAFWNGEIPLWNPLSHLGTPFLAQWNSLVLYPGSIIYLIIPGGWGVSLFCLVHQWIGGMGMYSLLHKWTGNRTAAGIAGILYGFNGLYLNSLAWPNNSAALAWFPWLLLFLQPAVAQGGRWLIAASFIGGMQMLTGGPEIILFSWFFCTVTVLCSLSWNFKSMGAGFLRLGFVAAWVAGLASAQLLPFLRMIQQSQRSAEFSSDGWSMPITGWGNFIIPKFQTFFSHAGVHFQPDQVWTTSYYIGIFTLALAGVFLLSRPRKFGWALIIIGFLAANLALGSHNPLYVLLKEYFPAVGFMRYPVKFTIFLIMGFPIMAGLGWVAFENLRKSQPSHPETAQDPHKPTRTIPGFLNCQSRFNTHWLWILGLMVTLTGGVLLAYTVWYPLHREMPERTIANGLWRIGFLWALIVAAYRLTEYQSGSNGRFKKLAHVIIPAVCALELLTHTTNQNPTVNGNVVEPGLITLKSLEPFPQHGVSRAMLSPTADLKLRFTSTENPEADYLVYRSGLFSNCNLLDGISKVNGFYSLYINRSSDIMRLFYGPKPFPAEPLKAFLGISHYSIPETPYEWRTLDNFMPLVTSGQIPVIAPDASRLSQIASPDFQPGKMVYIDESDADFFHNLEKEWKYSQSSLAEPESAMVVSSEGSSSEENNGLAAPLEVQARNLPPSDPSIPSGHHLDTDTGTGMKWHQANISNLKVSNQSLAMDLESPGYSMIVIAQNNYPGWKALLNGEPIKIFNANHAFQAVIVPKGNHHLNITYSDTDFKLGSLLSLLSLAALLLATIIHHQNPHQS